MGLMSINADPCESRPILDYVAEVTYWARQVSALALIQDLCEWYGTDHHTVCDCLFEISEDRLCLLDSSDGWAALGQLVGAALAIGAPPYFPQVH